MAGQSSNENGNEALNSELLLFRAIADIGLKDGPNNAAMFISQTRKLSQSSLIVMLKVSC